MRFSIRSVTIRNVSYRNSEKRSNPAHTSIGGGRPRDAAREAEILRVVLQMLAELGYHGLTFEGVARRARASKATLYRRWDTKRDMVVAAVRSGPAAHGEGIDVDTGSLRGDLLALCERLVKTLRGTDGATSLMLLQAGLEDAELCQHIEGATGPTGARMPPSVLAAAERRGELPAGSSPFPYEEVAGSVLLLRSLNGLSTDRAYLEQLVDSTLIPALQASSTTAVTAKHRGIFSGSPTAAS